MTTIEDYFSQVSSYAEMRRQRVIALLKFCSDHQISQIGDVFSYEGEDYVLAGYALPWDDPDIKYCLSTEDMAAEPRSLYNLITR